jgi:hypothetical protein
MPAMVVSATISTSPTLVYFGQELGEPGSEDAGFGKPSRTSIFDYVGVPSYQLWVNNKAFDGGQSTVEELELRDFYKRLLNVTIYNEAFMGDYYSLHQFNRDNTQNYNDKVLSFARWTENEQLIVISNFDVENRYQFNLKIPSDLVSKMQLADGVYQCNDMLYQDVNTTLTIKDGKGEMNVILKPLESLILGIKN